MIKPLARSKSQLNSSHMNEVVKLELFNHIEYACSTELDLSGGSELVVTDRFPVLLDNFSHQSTTNQCRHLETAFRHRLPGERVPDFRVRRGFKRLQTSTELIIGSRRSQRVHDSTRCNHRICYRQPAGQLRIGEVHFYAHMELGQWAWITELTGAVFDHHRGVASILNSGRSFWIPIEWIITVVGIIHHGGLNMIVGNIPELFE